MVEHPADGPTVEPYDYHTCACVYCAARRRDDEIAKITPDKLLEHAEIESEKLAEAWRKDWGAIVQRTGEKTGMSRLETLTWMMFQQLHGLRFLLMRYVDSYERYAAMSIQAMKEPPDDWQKGEKPE